MSVISSKPNDGDPIAEVRQDSLGNRFIIPNKLLITFFDDLVNNIDDSAGECVNALESSFRALASAFNKNPWLFCDVSVQNANYTTSRTETVIVTAAATVFLNDNAEDGERVIIKRATSAGSVIIDPQSTTIDGENDYTIVVNYEAIQCVYSSANDEWYIV